MKTCTIHGAKSLEIEDRPIPKPDTNELVIRLGAGGICGSIPWLTNTREPTTQETFYKRLSVLVKQNMTGLFGKSGADSAAARAIFPT